jgi:hypothetical protein
MFKCLVRPLIGAKSTEGDGRNTHKNHDRASQKPLPGIVRIIIVLLVEKEGPLIRRDFEMSGSQAFSYSNGRQLMYKVWELRRTPGLTNRVRQDRVNIQCNHD